jgi:hypothetical protein
MWTMALREVAVALLHTTNMPRDEKEVDPFLTTLLSMITANIETNTGQTPKERGADGSSNTRMMISARLNSNPNELMPKSIKNF